MTNTSKCYHSFCFFTLLFGVFLLLSQCKTITNIEISKYRIYHCDLCSSKTDTNNNYAYLVDCFFSKDSFIRFEYHPINETDKLAENLIPGRRINQKRMLSSMKCNTDSNLSNTFLIRRDSLYIVYDGKKYLYYCRRCTQHLFYMNNRTPIDSFMPRAQINDLRDSGVCSSGSKYYVVDESGITYSDSIFVYNYPSGIRRYFQGPDNRIIKLEYSYLNSPISPSFTIMDLELVAEIRRNRISRVTAAHKCHIPNSMDLLFPKYDAIDLSYPRFNKIR